MTTRTRTAYVSPALEERRALVATILARYRREAAFKSYVAIDPATGIVLRPATTEESAAYVDAACVAKHGVAFRKPARVGAVLIDEDRGPGRGHTPGRFLP